MDTKSRKEYMLERYRKRRQYAVERLGGACVICGTKEDLELDHILRSEKSFNISQMWSISQEKFDAELSKCQLLCHTCHVAKNTWEIGEKAAIRTHGTLSSYRYCKCAICKKAYSDYWQTYKPRKKRRGETPRKITSAKDLRED